MNCTLATKTLSVTINRDSATVYRFVSNAKNLPAWARAFCKSARKSGASWIIETPVGLMKLRFSAKNSLGVLDHYVYPATNVEVYVPMRVVPNGSGSEVIFTLFRRNNVSQAEYEQDIRMVKRDLKSLKQYLERKGRKS